MALDFEDIEGTAGDDNSSGIQQNIYLIDHRDVVKHPTFPKIDLTSATAQTLAALVTVPDDIELKHGRKAFRLQCTLEKGAGTSDSQGEIDGMSFKNGLKFLIPGNKANADGFARYAKNGSFYLLYFELDGSPRLLGNPGYPAKMVSAPGSTGEKTADLKGRTFTFQSVWSGPAPIFAGKVMIAATTPGDPATEQELVYLK
jgi:ABC-type phosphate/phosphonate transport system substrate-binding protein